MKPKVKGLKLAAPKEKLEIEAESHAPAQLNEDTASKQLKKNKLAKLKLKKSDKVKQLILQKKKEKQLSQTPVKPSAEIKKSSKKVPPEQAEKKPKLKRPSVAKAAPVGATGSSETAATGPEEPEPARDPLLRADIAHYLRQRAASTVRVRRIPNRLRYSQIGQLCSGVQAYRVPWNHAAGRHKGVAFLEFASPEAAKRAATELSTSKTLGFQISATVSGNPDAVDFDSDQQPGQPDRGAEHRHDEDALAGNVDAYNCRRVIVCGLHPFTTGQELKDQISGSGFSPVERVDFQHGSKQLRKNSPAVAFLTFTDERRALEAVKQFQGHTIRGRPTSWMLHKRSSKSEHPRHPTQLVAFGVSKRVTDEDLLKAFPNSKSLDVRQGHGMAVINYENETDCRTDLAACKGGVIRIGKARLCVELGAMHHRPAEERKAIANASPNQQQQQQQQQQRVPRQKKPAAPPKQPLNINPSLFNKCQLIVKNFKPATRDTDLSSFFPGSKRVFFTGNRRLAFVHFASETAASDALAKVGSELLNGAKLKAMYAMDKPDKIKKTNVDGGSGSKEMSGAGPADGAVEMMQVDNEQVASGGDSTGGKPIIAKKSAMKNKKKLNSDGVGFKQNQQNKKLKKMAGKSKVERPLLMA